MDKTLLVLLIAPTLLFTWDRVSANETKEFIADSGDQSKQSRRSIEGRDDSKGSRGEQTKGRDWESQRQQPQKQQYGKQEFREIKSGEIDQIRTPKKDFQQMRDPGDQIKRNWETEKKDKEFQGQKSGERFWDRSPKKDFQQMRDPGDQIKRNWETERKDKEFQGRKPGERDWDRSQKRDFEQKRDFGDQKRGWESEKRDAVKTFPDGFRDGDRRGDRRERISKERLKEMEIRWQSKSKDWRKNFSNYRKRDHIFDDHFWAHFRRRYNHWYFDNNFQWYSGATWPRVVVWLPWQWSRPIYYFYGVDGDVYYSTAENFFYLTPVDSKEIFIAQAARIANTRYPISNQQSDWLPLGMFALASDNDSSDMPKRYISLAISKDGAVSGAYFDAANNTTLEIQGGIDPASQRIAWKFVGNNWPIMESGLYNLTKEESTLLIHTSSRTTETQWLIRLDR